MRTRMRAARLALLGAALALSVGAPARALDGDVVDDEKWSWNKFWDYAGCISTLAMADNPPGVSAAIGMCGRMVVNWWHE